MESVYDYMASIARTILDNMVPHLCERYKAMPANQSWSIDKVLSDYFPEFMDNGNVRRLSFPYFLTTNLAKKLCSFQENCRKTQDIYSLIRLLSKLDAALGKETINFTTGPDGIYGLNENWKTVQLQLLPNCKSNWAHKNKDTVSGCCLNNYLNHYYFINTDELFKHAEGCEVRHYFISSNTFRRAREKGYLVIGITPLFNCAKLDVENIEVTEGSNYFKIKSLSPIEKTVKNALNILEKAKKNDVDILCFPEMLGTPELIESFQKVLKGFPENDDKEYPPLIICPTCWNNESNSAVLLDQMGNQILVQNKQWSFPVKNNDQTYLEGIRQDQCIHLLHCEGIGRIGILICKDALMRKYLNQFLDNLKATLLIVPSFSTGHYDFQENLDACKAYDCNAIWINTCSARSDSDSKISDPIGFIKRNGRRTTFRNGQFSFKPCKLAFSEQPCEGCLFTKEIIFDGTYGS